MPNVRRNAGDFIVVDHVNHFMPTSLRLLFANAGFTDVVIDEASHAAAYVVTARRGSGRTIVSPDRVTLTRRRIRRDRA